MAEVKLRGDELVGAGWLGAGKFSDAASGYFQQAGEAVMDGVGTLKGAPKEPMAIEAGDVAAVQDYLEALNAKESAKASFSLGGKLAARGVLAYEGAMAVKNAVVVSGYAAEESRGEMGTPDTNGKALVRDFTNAIESAKKTGAISEQDLFNMYGSAVVSQLFGAEAAIDPNSSSPIASADLANRYGKDIKNREYESSHMEEKEISESKSSRRAARQRAKEIRADYLNIPSIEEQKEFLP